MVRGPGDEPRISGKPDYDGTLKQGLGILQDHDQEELLAPEAEVARHSVWGCEEAAGCGEAATPDNCGEAIPDTGTDEGAGRPDTGTDEGAGNQQHRDMEDPGAECRHDDVQDGQKILGSLETSKVLDMISNGEVDRDSSLISYSPSGFFQDFWMPFTVEKELELYRSLRSEASVTPMRPLETDYKTDQKPTLYMPSELEEASDAKGRSEIDDLDSYHLIAGCISVKTNTGKALLLQIDVEMFSSMESGHKLFAWLNSRASEGFRQQRRAHRRRRCQG